MKNIRYHMLPMNNLPKVVARRAGLLPGGTVAEHRTHDHRIQLDYTEPPYGRMCNVNVERYDSARDRTRGRVLARTEQTRS